MKAENIWIAHQCTARALSARLQGLAILSVGDVAPEACHGSDCRRLWVPLLDDERVCIRDFWRAVDGLRALASCGADVLVTSSGGESRSSAVVVGWLLRDHPAVVASWLEVEHLLSDSPHPFLEAHRWFTEEDQQALSQVPRRLVEHSLFPALCCCYRVLSERFPYIACNPRMWVTLLTTQEGMEGLMALGERRAA